MPLKKDKKVIAVPIETIEDLKYCPIGWFLLRLLAYQTEEDIMPETTAKKLQMNPMLFRQKFQELVELGYAERRAVNIQDLRNGYMWMVFSRKQ